MPDQAKNTSKKVRDLDGAVASAATAVEAALAATDEAVSRAGRAIDAALGGDAGPGPVVPEQVAARDMALARALEQTAQAVTLSITGDRQDALAGVRESIEELRGALSTIRAELER